METQAGKYSGQEDGSVVSNVREIKMPSADSVFRDFSLYEVKRQFTNSNRKFLGLTLSIIEMGIFEVAKSTNDTK